MGSEMCIRDSRYASHSAGDIAATAAASGRSNELMYALSQKGVTEFAGVTRHEPQLVKEFTVVVDAARHPPSPM